MRSTGRKRSFSFSCFPPLFVSVVLTGGCVAGFGLKPENSAEMLSDVARSDRETHESRTLSHLAALEIGLNDYIRAESRVPSNLQELIPKYLAEIPSLELGIAPHRDNMEVKKYPTSIIQDGSLDRSKLKDSGQWGYVHNDQQVIIFIDCTHKNSRGKPWYQERGVF